MTHININKMTCDTCNEKEGEYTLTLGCKSIPMCKSCLKVLRERIDDVLLDDSCDRPKEETSLYPSVCLAYSKSLDGKKGICCASKERPPCYYEGNFDKCKTRNMYRSNKDG